MKIDLYDVIRLKDGREVTVLLIHGKNEAYEVVEDDAPFAVARSQVEKVIWKQKEHIS